MYARALAVKESAISLGRGGAVFGFPSFTIARILRRMVDDTSDAALRRILESTRTIAMVGASLNPARASFRVGQFLLRAGYQVIPVNPVAEGERLFGRRVLGSLAEAGPVEMVDVFRRSDAVTGIVEEVLAGPGAKTIWLQLGVRDDDAAEMARARGIEVVQDRCPAIEMPRLGISGPASSSAAGTDGAGAP